MAFLTHTYKTNVFPGEGLRVHLHQPVAETGSAAALLIYLQICVICSSTP